MTARSSVETPAPRRPRRVRFVRDLRRGAALSARALRGAACTILGFGTSQGVRFAANLLLTRLLFPEAFGMMALVSVIVTGLAMLSDAGIGPSVSQHRQGDDATFLDTAWTIQILRGVLLWFGAFALAAPAARLYDAPELAHLVPVAAIALLVSGFVPTKALTAERHLMLGRITLINLASQAAGVAMMILLAIATGSVWALAIAGVAEATVKLALVAVALPGRRNRLRFDRGAARELVHFGKWIFPTTMLAFLISQGDRALFGVYLSLEALGVYNIGFFLASFPLMLSGQLIGRIFLPLYRGAREEGDTTRIRGRIRHLRATITAATLTMLFLLGITAQPLVHLLFDPRYALAAAVVAAMTLVQMVQAVGLTYDQAALAAGDSNGFFRLFAGRSVVQIGGMVAGLSLAGLPGMFLAQGLAGIVTHLLIIRLARRHKVWDPLHDGIALGAAAAAIAIIWTRDGALIGTLNELH